MAETSVLPGSAGYQILERACGDAIEMTLVTYWASLENVKAFAGEEIERAVLYPGDERYEIVPETEVRHWQVIDAAWPAGA